MPFSSGLLKSHTIAIIGKKIPSKVQSLSGRLSRLDNYSIFVKYIWTIFINPCQQQGVVI